MYEFGPFRLDVARRVFTRGNEVVPLAPKTFDLLTLMLQSPGRAFSKHDLMGALWPDTFVEEANLSFQISVLRKALGEAGATGEIVLQPPPALRHRLAQRPPLGPRLVQ